MKTLTLCAALVAGFAFANTCDARDLTPSARIGGAYCYSGWLGDGGVAHTLLTDRLLTWEHRYDEASSGYKFKPGTRYVDVDFDTNDYRKPGWDVSYNDPGFYRQQRVVALACMKKVFPHVVRETPLTRIISVHHDRSR